VFPAAETCRWRAESSTTTQVYDQSGNHHRRRWSVCSSKERMPRLRHLSRRRNAANRALIVWKRTDVRRERYRLPYSYPYSSSLMMTPASSSTVVMFHRRVGRYRIPMTCYLARRAVRRRTSSTDAWGHASVSVGAPCRSRRTGHHRTLLISSPWSAVQPLSAGRQGLTLWHAVENRCRISGSDRCLHPGDTSRSSL